MFWFYSILGNGFVPSLYINVEDKEISCCLVTSFTQANEGKAKELHAIFKC